MRKLLLGLLAFGSFSLHAHTRDLCRHAYESHVERLELIRELSRIGELSQEKADARLKDAEALLEISKSLMCKGISRKDQATFEAEVLKD